MRRAIIPFICPVCGEEGKTKKKFLKCSNPLCRTSLKITVSKDTRVKPSVEVRKNNKGLKPQTQKFVPSI